MAAAITAEMRGSCHTDLARPAAYPDPGRKPVIRRLALG